MGVLDAQILSQRLSDKRQVYNPLIPANSRTEIYRLIATTGIFEEAPSVEELLQLVLALPPTCRLASGCRPALAELVQGW